MICTFLRALQYTEKLPRSSGKRLFLPHSVLHKAGLKTEPNLRWGLPEQKKPVRPRCILGVTPKTIWTQGRSPRRAKEDSDKQVSVHRSQREGTAVSTAQKGGLFYVIFKELFSPSSPNKIYGKALEKCRSHPETAEINLDSGIVTITMVVGASRERKEVIGVFGEPIKGYGEMTRRGRRQHVSFIEYVKDGLKHMRLKFYIQGSEPGKQGTVHLEVKENPESGECEFRYVFVEVESYPRRTIVIEDNRSSEN